MRAIWKRSDTECLILDVRRHRDKESEQHTPIIEERAVANVVSEFYTFRRHRQQQQQLVLLTVVAVPPLFNRWLLLQQRLRSR
jgi:hypothetical protein